MEIAFIIISIISLLLLYIGLGKSKTITVLFFSWQIVIGILAFLDVFENSPQIFPLAIGGTLMLTLISFWKTDTSKLNMTFLVGLHILRIPVELVLFQLYIQGKVPRLMTFSGWNFDIIIGISSLLIVLYMLFSKKELNRKLFLVWNIIGLLFLLFIVSLAILSSPLPIQQLAFDQPNVAVLAFPYCFLPTCVVPAVLLSHVLLIRYTMVGVMKKAKHGSV